MSPYVTAKDEHPLATFLREIDEEINVISHHDLRTTIKPFGLGDGPGPHPMRLKVHCRKCYQKWESAIWDTASDPISVGKLPDMVKYRCRHMADLSTGSDCRNRRG